MLLIYSVPLSKNNGTRDLIILCISSLYFSDTLMIHWSTFSARQIHHHSSGNNACSPEALASSPKFLLVETRVILLSL